MTPDRDIERNVTAELQWNPDLDASDIAVSVKDGVVTLARFGKSYTNKYEAESAVKRLRRAHRGRYPAHDQGR